jgi:hypothetical protein
MTSRSNTTSTPAAKTRTERATDGLLVIIVLLVGLMAGAASFTHVHDWTMHNSPARTYDWFGWANAVITELIPTAALIVIARRRRTGAPIGYPMLLLVVAVGLSLTAQLAVAQPSVFGWMVSALPALAFFALSKLVFTATRPTNPVPASTPAPVAPAPSLDTAPATGRPAARKTTATTKTPAKKTNSTPRKTTAKKTTAPATPVPVPAAPAPVPATVPAASVSAGMSELLPNARRVAEAHRHAHGEPITSGQLAVRLRVPTTTAEHILDQLDKATAKPATRTHNGSPTQDGPVSTSRR